MAGGAAIDRRSPAAGVLGHVRGDPHRAQLVDEVLRIEALVGPQRDPLRPVGVSLDHRQGRHALGMAVGLGQAGVDQKPRAVLHQPVADEAQPRLLARPLAIEPGVGIRRRSVRRIRPLLFVEVGWRVAAAGRRRCQWAPKFPVLWAFNFPWSAGSVFG
jgi:hypothetical protein